jgi:hypothetical protein
MSFIKSITLAALLATSSAGAQSLEGELNNSHSDAEISVNKFSVSEIKLPKSEFVKIDAKTVPLENIAMNEEQPDWTYIAGISTLTGLAAYLVHEAYTHQFWWPDRSPAHWMVDNNYALGIDKAGHAFAFNTLATGYYRMFKTAGFEDMTARIMGATTGAVWQFYTESHELRGPNKIFGGDPLDIAGGWLGASKVILDGLSPFSNDITLKMSFFPRQHPKYDKYNSMENDYLHQNPWLSYNIKNGVSIAVGLRLSTWQQGDPNAHVQILIAPDFDFRTLSDSPIVEFFNRIKLPVPALMIEPSLGKISIDWSYKFN